MKAKVDQETCIGCETCVGICPAVFEMNSKDKSSVKGESVPADAQEDCRKAVASCPVGAISIEE